MPDIDKNIVITPNRGSTLQPNIVFTGQGVDPITVRVLDGATGTGITAGGALSFEGSQGQLFSIVNRLGTGSIFSVNDISGIPSLDIDASGRIHMAAFTGFVGIGLTAPSEKLHVSGNVLTSGRISAVGGLSASGGLGVTGGATFNGNVRINSSNILYLNAIESLNAGQMTIDGRASARVSIGDYSSLGQSCFFFVRDAANLVDISNPFGDIRMGDPNLVDSGSFITYNASSGALNGNNANEIIGFSAVRAGIINATSGLCAEGVSAGSYILSSSGVKALTGTTYTFLTTDNGRILTFNNGSAITVTIPTGLPIGFNCTAIQLGAGQVGFTNAAGVTLQSYSNQYRLIGQHASATIIEYTTNIVNLSGNLIT